MLDTDTHRRDTIKKPCTLKTQLLQLYITVDKKERSCGGVLTLVERDGGHSAGIEHEDV